jgi:hypothetical protein
MRAIHTQTHRESRLTTEELLQVVLSLLQFDWKFHKEDNSLLRTVVSSQSQHAEILDLEDLITNP